MTPLAAGKIETLVWTPEKRLIKTYTIYGDHSEKIETKWIPCPHKS